MFKTRDLLYLLVYVDLKPSCLRFFL